MGQRLLARLDTKDGTYRSRLDPVDRHGNKNLGPGPSAHRMRGWTIGNETCNILLRNQGTGSRLHFADLAMSKPYIEGAGRDRMMHGRRQETPAP